MKIAIHGATGSQGSPVASELESRGITPLRLSRDGAQGLAIDLNDVGSLVDAYHQTDALFIHLPIPSDHNDPERWARNIVTALSQSQVSRVVYSTSGTSLRIGDAGPHPTLQQSESGALEFYRHLTSVVPNVVALAPRLFLDNLLLPFVAAGVRESGVLGYPLAADKPISWTSHADVARVAADALQGKHPSGSYDVGLRALTGPELAESIAIGVGHPVRYDAISPAEFGKRAAALFGPDAAVGIATLYEAYADDPSRAIPSVAVKLAGNGGHRSVAEWARETFG